MEGRRNYFPLIFLPFPDPTRLQLLTISALRVNQKALFIHMARVGFEPTTPGL